MSWFGIALMVVVTAAVVVLILVFERKRARQIEHDLHDDRRPPSRGRGEG